MRKQDKCSTCYWSGRCCRRGGCEDFLSVDRYFSDESADLFIESERESFREEWFEYAEEMLNEMFF